MRQRALVLAAGYREDPDALNEASWSVAVSPGGKPADYEKALRQAEAAHRIVVFGDVLDYAFFFVPDDRVPRDEKAWDKSLRKPGLAHSSIYCSTVCAGVPKRSDLSAKGLDRLIQINPRRGPDSAYGGR